LLQGTIFSALLIAVDSVLVLGCLSRGVAIISAFFKFLLCGHNCCCYFFCNEQYYLSHGATMLTLFCNTKVFDQPFVAMPVAERSVLLQVQRRFIAMVRDCDWCNQFYRGHFGIFTRLL
jgi:hypothetical protein